MADPSNNERFSSKKYWDDRYNAGGNAGAGSYGVLGKLKVDFINSFVELNAIENVVDFGCGDGALLKIFTSIAHYTGVETSAAAIQRCRNTAAAPQFRFVDYDGLADVAMAPLVLSLDVIYNLVEAQVYEKYLRDMFCFATKFVIVYSSDHDADWPSPHIRHRCVSRDIASRYPEWRLAARIPNPYPYDRHAPGDTSFCDFMVFARQNEEICLRVPQADRAAP